MKKRRRSNRFSIFILIFAVVFIFSYFIDKRAMPMLEYYAETQGTSAVTEAINSSVKKSLSEKSRDETDFVNYEKNSDGKITAINIDAKKLNYLKASLTADLIGEMRKIQGTPIKVPVGTLSGIGIFYGKGPNINLEVIPEGSVVSDIETDFSSSGINQTAHRIYWTVSAEFYVVLPEKTISFAVSNRFLLSETVIVGEIPQVYFRNQGE